MLPMQMDRRQFLSAAGGAAGCLILPSSRSARAYQANDAINLAVIGVSGFAAATAFIPGMHLYRNLRLVALCDVDQRKVDRGLEVWQERAARWPRSPREDERRAAELYRQMAEQPPPLFNDYREMLDRMGEQIDAVVVATPDHSHAPASAAALRAGKHVFCEKPLTVTVKEARALRDLAAQRQVATSLGNQGTQSPQFRRGLELIRQGVLGPIEEVHVWFSRGGVNLRQPPRGTPPVPPELNWDLWLGPVAWREYHPEWIARTHWRDTSAGQLGNFGPHTANLAFMALNVAGLWQGGQSADAGMRTSRAAAATQISVQAECSQINRLSFPVWEKIHWQVPSRGELPPVTFTWHHGPLPDYGPGSRELIEGLMRGRGASDEDIKRWAVYAGCVIVGRDGTLVTDSHNVNISLLPKEKFADLAIDQPRSVQPSGGHYHDWVLACRGGDPPWTRFEYSAVFNEFLMLGDVATRFPGQRLEYDARAARIINNSAADAALGYDYRPGWKL